MAGLEGNLGKRVAGEKSMLISGEMEAGHTPRYGVGREASSGETNAAMKKLKGKKKEGQYLLPCSENVDDLRRMFDDWAAAYEKVYSSDEEREGRFQIFLSNKKYVDEQNSLSRRDVLGLNVFGDMRDDEIPFGACTRRYIPLQHVGMRPDLTGMNSEESKEAEIGQDLLNDPKLWRAFDRWAASSGKVYKNDKERRERFQIFVSTWKFLDMQNDHDCDVNYDGDYYGLNEFSDMRDHELPFGCSIGGHNPPVYLQMKQDAVINSEDLKEAWNEFERWAAAHGKVYGFEGERQFRFLFFMDNKSKLGIGKSNHDFWKSPGYDWSIMDAMGGET